MTFETDCANLHWISRSVFYDIREQTGVLRNLIIRTSSTEETMVTVQFGEDAPGEIKKIMDFLQVTFPHITSLLYIVNLKKNETFNDLEVITYSGQDYYHRKDGRFGVQNWTKILFPNQF